jgi:alpha-1,3-rhamnosyltransferase
VKAEQPLVSIVVITYNSSKYVLETLESAKAQTYENIELIISDDGSTDETIVICQEWLDRSQSEFVNTKLITVKNNSGIPANCNRGVKASEGEWIKLIAGDDVLLKDCIKINTDATKKSNLPLYFSNMVVFNQKGELNEITNNYNIVAKWFGSKDKNSKKKSYFRYPIMLNIPTLFIKKSIIKSLEGFDERFKLLEDQPFLLKLFKNDYDIEHINKATVKYRSHFESVMNNQSELFSNNLRDSYQLFSRPYLSNYNLKDLIFKTYRDISFYLILKNYHTNRIAKFFLRLKNLIYKLS